MTSARTGLRLAPDNRAAGWETIDDLVAADAPFAVVPAAHLLVVDLDVDRIPAPAARARRAAFKRLVAAARTHGVPHVVVASGRPGHRHAFVVVGDRDAHRVALESACRAAGLDVRTRGVRPPLAAHRIGGRGTLLHPATPQLAVAVLEAPAVAGGAAALAAAVGRRLSHRVRRTLVDGFAAGGYLSASEGRMALAVHCVSRGLTPPDLRRLLEDPQHTLGASFRSRPARWRTREIDRLWGKARQWVAAHPQVARPAGDADEVTRIAAAAAGSAWPGMGGASDLATLEALLDVAARVGRAVVSAALADVAIGAGLSVDTTRAAVRRLATAGWVSVVAEATPTAARTYQLHVPDSATGPETAARAGDDAWSDLGADAARWGALGKSAVRVARALSSATSSVTDLAATLSSSPNAVRIQLRRLAAHGVARRVPGGWVRADASPDEVAADLGTAGARSRQRAEVAAVRADRRTLRARWREAVAALRHAYVTDDEATWWDAVMALPPRVVAAHQRRLRTWHAPPAFAA